MESTAQRRAFSVPVRAVGSWKCHRATNEGGLHPGRWDCVETFALYSHIVQVKMKSNGLLSDPGSPAVSGAWICWGRPAPVILAVDVVRLLVKCEVWNTVVWWRQRRKLRPSRKWLPPVAPSPPRGSCPL